MHLKSCLALDSYVTLQKQPVNLILEHIWTKIWINLCPQHIKLIRHRQESHRSTVQFNFIYLFLCLFWENHPTKLLHPTSQNSKAAQSVSQIQRQRASKSEQFGASDIVKGLAAHTSPFSGRQGGPDYAYQASTVWFRRDEGLLLWDNLNGLSLTAKCASSDREWRGGQGEMREGGRGPSEVRPPLSIMMTANERMAGWGLLSGIISLHHYEKGDNGDLSLSERISHAIHSRTDEKARWVPRS